jgi:hypothetical protein
MVTSSRSRARVVPLIILGLCFLIAAGFGVAGWQFHRENRVETSPSKYADLVDRASWAPNMPKQIPQDATNIRFRYDVSTGIFSRYAIQLGVTLPEPKVQKLLQDHRSRHPSLQGGDALTDPTLETLDWMRSEKFDLVTGYRSRNHYDGIAINPQTNRVIWFFYQSSD